jgi:adenylosuccinate synthase
MRYVIVFSGPVAVGKSVVMEALLERFPGVRASTRRAIIEATGADNERGALQEA